LLSFRAIADRFCLVSKCPTIALKITSTLEATEYCFVFHLLINMNVSFC
jgi:hypothetical protein